MPPKAVDPLFNFVQNNINQRRKERKREKKVIIKVVYLITLFTIRQVHLESDININGPF